MKRADDAPAIPTAWLALAVTVAVAVTLLVSNAIDLSGNYGDTDDALRLVIVRDLLSGRAGWYDQHMMRLQPPVGMDLHWSRLIDGGLAGLQSLLRLALPPDRAELAMRALWPLIWIFPAAAAAISIARRLRGNAAALLCAAMLAMDLLLYGQWVPGRIDHHDVQIALALVALAGAMGGGWRGALAAGLATGLGVAVGLEGLIFFAVVGAGVALWFLAAPAQQARSVQAYAVGLLVTLPLFLIETPPARWTLSVCDTIGANLVAGLAIAAVGLLACVALTARRGAWVRFAGLGAVAALAGGTYLRMDVTCLHGPLAGADPRIWPIWLSHVNEMLPLSRGLADLTNAVSWAQAILLALGAAAWLWLGRRREARTAGWLMAGAWLALAAAAGVAAARMTHYSAWLATALLAAAAADIAARYARRPLVPAILLAVALTPTWPTSILTIVGERLPRPYPKDSGAACRKPTAYAPLASRPTGLVLGEIDLGPYALAATSHAVLSAPYHRMGWGILAAHEVLAAAPGADEAAARRLHVDYVIDCPAHANVFTHSDLPRASLQKRLDRAQVPAWLRPLTPAAAPLQIYAVRPKAAG